MSAKRVCKNCKLFVEKNVTTCPSCKGHQFGDTFKGRIYILNVEKSEIGKKMDVKLTGEYAIKAR